MTTWTRVADGHPRWEIKNPSGDGRNYLVTDEAIRTFGRKHMTELMINLPPLPEEAWTPPARKEVTIMTNRDPGPGICGHPGSGGGVCGLVPGHREPHRPLHVRQDPEPIRTPQDMILRYPGMTLEQARNALQRSLRCLGERGFALLTVRWRARSLDLFAARRADIESFLCDLAPAAHPLNRGRPVRQDRRPPFPPAHHPP